MCIERGISLQEFFEEIAQKALTNDPRIERILDEFVRAKKERYFKQLAPADAKSLFDIIEIESPLK
jgi:DNA-binding protein Fis